MAARILLNFGGCKFEKDGVTATFSGGKGIFEFSPIQFRRRKANGGWANKLKGYDVKSSCTELYNIESTDYEQYQALANILTALIGVDETVTVTPRFDGIEETNSYECFLDSSFKPEDLHRVKIGQVVGLNFIAKDMSIQIPTNISDVETKNWVFETSDGTQENAVFETSNTVQENAIFKE